MDMSEKASPPAIPLPGRGFVSIAGADAVPFLNGLVSNDVTRAQPGQAVAAALLTPQGKLLFDMLIFAQPGGLLLECDRAEAQALTQKLVQYRLRTKITIQDASDQFMAVAVLSGPSPRIADAWVVPDPRLADLGWRVIVRRADTQSTLAAHDWTLGQEVDYHRFRLALGVPEGPADAPRNDAFLLDINAEELHMVDFRKGCYVGQELTARMKHRGTARRRIVRALFEGPAAAPGTAVLDGEREIGQILGGQGNAALALVRLDRWKDATHPLTGGGAGMHLKLPAYPLILPEEGAP